MEDNTCCTIVIKSIEGITRGDVHFTVCITLQGLVGGECVCRIER